jgi:hypothetical protein
LLTRGSVLGLPGLPFLAQRGHRSRSLGRPVGVDRGQPFPGVFGLVRGHLAGRLAVEAITVHRRPQ